jgi:hypothetical protein
MTFHNFVIFLVPSNVQKNLKLLQTNKYKYKYKIHFNVSIARLLSLKI